MLKTDLIKSPLVFIYLNLFWCANFTLFAQNIVDNNITIQIKKTDLIDNSTSVIYLDSLSLYSKDSHTQYDANYQLGRHYHKIKKQYLLSKEYFYRAREYSKIIDSKPKLAEVYLNLAFVNNKLAVSDSALYYYEKCLVLYHQVDDLMGISLVNSNIARLYNKENKKGVAAFYRRAIYYGNLTNRNLCTTYNNFGNYYLDFKKIDSAIIYYKKSLEIAQTKKIRKHELRANINLGISFLQKKNYIKAFKTLKDAEQITHKLEKTRFQYYALYHLGRYYSLTKQAEIAILYYNKALALANVKTDYRKQMEVLQTISVFYNDNKNYKKALFYNDKYYQLRDSISSVKRTKGFDDIRTKYEVEKKDNEIVLLTKERELEESRKKAVVLGAITTLSVLLLFVFFLRNKISLEKLARTQEQKLFEKELETKKAISHMEGQENERARLAKELHDGLGGQLSGIKSMVQAVDANNLQEELSVVDLHLSSSIKNLRNISHDLSAAFFKNKDYTQLIQQLLQDSFDKNKVQTEVSLFPPKKINELSSRYKLNIYRILQESFQNILKHANANFVSVSIAIGEKISIIIEDNGVGFNLNVRPTGIGLQNIRDRLFSLEAKLQIDSKKNSGTTLNIQIPYDE